MIWLLLVYVVAVTLALASVTRFAVCAVNEQMEQFDAEREAILCERDLYISDLKQATIDNDRLKSEIKVLEENFSRLEIKCQGWAGKCLELEKQIAGMREWA